MCSSKKEALLTFIRTYKSLPELWNTQNPLYSNNKRKSAAYEVLKEKLKPLEPDATRASVVKKINSLRCAFRKELKKVEYSKNSREAGDDVYVPKLWYFQEMMFLVDQNIADFNDTALNGLKYEISPNLVTSTLPTDYASVPIGSVSSAYSFEGCNKKRKIFSTRITPQDAIFTTTRFLESEDEYLTFAKGYAAKLRKLSPRQFMFADRLINEALLDGQLGYLRRESYLVHPESASAEPQSPVLETSQLTAAVAPSELLTLETSTSNFGNTADVKH